jgi:hypothetical protein
MKMRHLLYLTIILGLLLPMSALTVLAEDPEVIPMWIQRARLTWTGRSSGGPDAVVGFIHIRDGENDMVEGALVDAVWTLPDGTSLAESIDTNRQGIAIFSLWEGRGEYTLCVTDVTKAGWDYQPELNFDTMNNDTGCQLFVVP